VQYRSPMFEKILQFLHIACGHRNLSKPFTAANEHAKSDDWDAPDAASHYVVCLECGKKFAYDWANMRVIW